MTVAVDATGTVKSSITAVASVSYTNITVGSSLTNSAMILFLCPSNAVTTSPTAIWDSGTSNQSMTLITTSPNETVHNGLIYIFGLLNPIAGNKTLLASWTTSAAYAMCAISFTGVDQTNTATAFPNSTTTSNTGTALSISVTSAVGNIPVCAFMTSTGLGTPGQTQIYFDNVAQDDTIAQRAAGATSVNFTAATSPSAFWTGAGCDVAAVAAVSNILSAQIWI